MKYSFVLFALSALVLAACGKRAGGSCKTGESTCTDKKTALACASEKFVEVNCGGPLGCTKYQEHANCDTSVGVEGSPCMGEDDEYACTADNKKALLCVRGRFERYLECRGKAGCAVAGKAVSCDTTVAQRGDPCKTPDAVACSEDNKQMLRCRTGKFELHRQCRGKFGCFMKGDAPSCDETISGEGDPCGTMGQIACSVTGDAELVCQNGQFNRSRSCPKGCTVTNRATRPIECN